MKEKKHGSNLLWFASLTIVFAALSTCNISGQEGARGMIVGNPEFSASRIQAKFSSGEWLVGRLEFSKSGDEVSCTSELHSASGVEISNGGDFCELAASQISVTTELDIVVLLVLEVIKGSPGQELDFHTVLLGHREKEAVLPTNLVADRRVSRIVSEIQALEYGRVLVIFGRDVGN